jgi:hypothetical protein
LLELFTDKDNPKIHGALAKCVDKNGEVE